jgi:hypothetical protein
MGGGGLKGNPYHLLPPYLTLLLTDLTRSQRRLGLMTQTRAGFMTRDPRKEDVVTIPRVG